MKCWLEVISSPTADTPGTLLLLHFDTKRYLLGNLAEGTSRACLQHGLGLRKVDDILLTGRTRWSNIGGMLGLILSLADTKKAAAEAQVEQEQNKKLSHEKKNADGRHGQAKQDKDETTSPESSLFLRMHGAPNLNYAIATARRFIFRTGLPIEAVEHAASAESTLLRQPNIPPTWTDELLQVWTMPVKPDELSTSSSTTPIGRPQSRKRSHEEMSDDNANSQADRDPLSKRIVKQMFDSDWRMDRLFPKALKDVQMPSTLFVRDDNTGHLAQYTGPTPGSGKPLPDIDVLVRQPWPGAMTEELLSAEPAPETLCYIIKNHPQRGKFNPQKAINCGIEDKSLFGQLTKGHSVTNAQGEEITPDMVLEPGKQGGGIAIVEVPSNEYVQNLVSRPEWRNQSVMDGVAAILWLLGPDVAHNAQLQAFQKEFGDLKHIISSPDTREDGLVLETAVKAAWRHNNADAEVYPKLVTDSRHLRSRQVAGEGLLENHVAARRGLILNIEPAISLDESQTVPYVDDGQMTTTVKQEHDRLLTNAPDLISPTIPIPTSQPDSAASPWYTTRLYSNIEITTLGTGSSHPSAHRNVSATLVRIPSLGSYLFDCGEGTLGTLRRMFNKPELDDLFRDLRMIWISHMHADHHLGTTSVIGAWYEAVHGSIPSETTVNASCLENDGPRLAVVSDAPMLHWLREFSAIDDFGFSRLLPLATQPTRFATDPDPNRATSTELKLATSNESFAADTGPTSSYLSHIGLKELSTVLVPHCRGAQAVSCTFDIASAVNDAEPKASSQFKVSFSGDTRPSRAFACIGRDSDVLIHESTFDDDMRGEALAKKHSTAGEALTVAKEMRAKLCVLTHFSQRYPKMSGMGGGSVGGHGGTRKMKEIGMELNSTLRSDADKERSRNGVAGDADVELAANMASARSEPDIPMTDEPLPQSQPAINGDSSDTHMSSNPATPTTLTPSHVQATAESDLTNQSMPATASTHPLEAQPWSTPNHRPLHSHPHDLSEEYRSLMSHPGGLAGAIAEAGIKVIPAFDYMRLRLDNVDQAVAVQPMLRALEDFSEREKEEDKARRAAEEELKKKEEMERKLKVRLEKQALANPKKKEGKAPKPKNKQKKGKDGDPAAANVNSNETQAMVES